MCEGSSAWAVIAAPNSKAVEATSVLDKRMITVSRGFLKWAYTHIWMKFGISSELPLLVNL
jgi:hypothetical protein